jgi:O-antigen/teichoic acid export membrane protein
MKLFENKPLLSWRHYYHSNFLFKKFAGVLGVDILVKASAFILIPLYLRLMSQEDFGMYNYLLSIIQTFSLILNLGLYIPQSKLYHALQTRKEKGELLFTIISTLLFFIVILSVPMIIFRWDFKIIGLLFKTTLSYAKYRVFVLYALPITLLSFMLTNFFYTSEKIRQVKSYNLFRLVLINLIVLLGLCIIKRDTVQVRLALGYGVELILLLLFAYSFFKELVPNFNFKFMIGSLKMGLPIMVSALFGIIINFSDKFFLEKYGTLKDLSNYFLAFSFANIIPLIFASLQNVWTPIFLKEQNLESNVKKTNKLISKLLILFSVLAIGIWSLFLFLIETNIIPAKYHSVIFLLPFLLITQIVMSFSGIFSNYLVYFEKTLWVSYSGLFVSIISLCMGIWLIPVWGVFGAAISSLISNLIYLLIYYHLSSKLKEKYLKAPIIKSAPVYEYVE